MAFFDCSELLDVVKLVDTTIALSGIRGFLEPVEGCALHYLAAYAPGEGCIVEIGSFFGKSTAFLASGCKFNNRGWVGAVDHFLGSPEHQKGGIEETSEIIEQGSVYPQFERNMQQLGLMDTVKVFKGYSQDVAKQWQDPIRLLFIDGNHSYENSRLDFESWEPHVTKDGLICFHDIGNPLYVDGITRFFNEITNDSSSRLELVCQIRTLAVLQKK
ncbi:MAG: class I SAM-dependent methyltransferase [Nostoc sp.]|uniref:class I SAM-dependent methyltransferase n=1 Tax=Nostoc sp. TaxID=1180 RepID=UPI002FF94F4F